jgi:hypothetical protein
MASVEVNEIVLEERAASIVTKQACSKVVIGIRNHGTAHCAGSFARPCMVDGLVVPSLSLHRQRMLNEAALMDYRIAEYKKSIRSIGYKWREHHDLMGSQHGLSAYGAYHTGNE